jgi:toxin ParE1/3/4
MAEYRLSIRARSQLLDIYEFTNTTFGPYQAEAYHAGLERTFGLLADFPRIGQPADELASRHRVSGSNRTASFIQKRTHTS